MKNLHKLSYPNSSSNKQKNKDETHSAPGQKEYWYMSTLLKLFYRFNTTLMKMQNIYLGCEE